MGELKRGLVRERKERGFGGWVTPHLFFSWGWGGGGGGVCSWDKKFGPHVKNILIENL